MLPVQEVRAISAAHAKISKWAVFLCSLSRLKVSDLKDKLDLKIKDYKKTIIIFRVGGIDKEEDLNRCGISKAKSVVIADESDFVTIKAILAIKSALAKEPNKIENFVISTMIYEKKNETVIKSLGKDLPLETVYLKSTIIKIISQSAVVCGLSHVYNNLFDYENDEIYFTKSNKKYSNIKFSDIIYKSRDAIVIGVLDKGKPILNPGASYELNSDNELIIIAEQNNVYEKTKKDIDMTNKINTDIIIDTPRISSKSQRKILIIGYNEKSISVVKEISKYCMNNSKFIFLVNTKENKDELQNEFKDDSSIVLQISIGITHDEVNLKKIYKKGFDSIIIFSNKHKNILKGIDEDENSILSLIHINEIQKELNDNIPIIIEIKHSDNIGIIDQIKVDDYVVSEDIASKMLAQISKDKRLNIVFHELLKSEGYEIYFKPIIEYVDISEKFSFYTLSEAASRKQEIAIGYKKSSIQGAKGIFLNPSDKGTKKLFNKNDYIIVISLD